MIYKEYIDLGFERIDLDDNIEFNQTGYGGFVLEYRIKQGVLFYVNNDNLNEVKLYVAKDNSEDRFYTASITPDMAKRMIEIFKQ